MDINTIDDGNIAVIKTSAQFIIKINNEFFGPYPNTKKSVKKVYNVFKSHEEGNPLSGGAYYQ